MNPRTRRPTLSALINGTRVDVGWDWSGFANFLDQIEIQVDRGQGFIPLAFDTTPGYVDTQPFPAAPVKWTYQAIYRVGDNRVGQWSQLLASWSAGNHFVIPQREATDVDSRYSGGTKRSGAGARVRRPIAVPSAHLEHDFSPGGTHAAALVKIDAAIAYRVDDSKL
jgi:hypothetical protein